MKLIKGDTLDALLKANAPKDALAVFGAVSQAVGYDHALDEPLIRLWNDPGHVGA